MKFVLASGNEGKYREMRDALAAIGVELMFGGDFKNGPEPKEDGTTYEENALIKARAWAEYTNIPAIADDSGLEVAALDGAPGIRSARSVSGSDSDRCMWLLAKMDGKADRSAQFVSCIATVFPNKSEPIICEGRCPGRIAKAASGNGGFGYDPLFVPEGYGETFAELPPSIKLRISHRALALQKLTQKLKPVIESFIVR